MRFFFSIELLRWHVTSNCLWSCPIYEELIPLGLAKKIKTEDEEAALSKAKSSCANIPTFDTNPWWKYDGFDCNGELDDATSERLISSIGHAEEGLISSIGE